MAHSAKSPGTRTSVATPTERWIHAGQFRWRVNPAFLDDALLACLKDPAALVRPPAVTIKRNPFNAASRVVRTRLAGWRDAEVVVKIYRRENIWRSFKDWCRVSRARRAFEYARALQAAGVTTPTPIAFGEQRRAGWLVAAYLITEAVRAETLMAFLERHPPDLDGVAIRLAELLGRLHRAGFSHRDLKPGNVLIVDGHSPCLIDLDGVRRFGELPDRRAARDLARLARAPLQAAALGAVRAARFLQAYARTRGRSDWRHWWRQIVAELRSDPTLTQVLGR